MLRISPSSATTLADLVDRWRFGMGCVADDVRIARVLQLLEQALWQALWQLEQLSWQPLFFHRLNRPPEHELWHELHELLQSQLRPKAPAKRRRSSGKRRPSAASCPDERMREDSLPG